MDSKEYYMLIDKIQEMLIDLQSDYSVSSLHSNLNKVEAELLKLRFLKPSNDTPQLDPNNNITIDTPKGKLTFVDPIIRSIDYSNLNSYYLPSYPFRNYDTSNSPNTNIEINRAPINVDISLSCTNFIQHNS